MGPNHSKILRLPNASLTSFPGSPDGACTIFGGPACRGWPDWELLRTLPTRSSITSRAQSQGSPQSINALGAELFEYYSDNPAEGRAFTGAMAVSSMEVAGEVARVLDTSSAKLVVDIGGASGALISTLDEKSGAYRSYIGTPRGRAARPSCRS